MKVSLYIDKKDFDTFFIWMNRINQGTIQRSPVPYSTEKKLFNDPLQLFLSPAEYNLIQDTERNLEDIQRIYGSLDITYKPESLETEKIVMADILRNAQRYDVSVDLVNTAIQLAMQIPGITPLEALIISEKEWINAGKSHI